MISGRVKMVEERKTGPDDYRDGARVPRWWLYSISIIYNQVVMKWWWVAKPGNHRSTTTDGEIDKHASRFCCRWRRCGFHHNERVRRPQTNNFQNEGKRIKKEEEVVFSAAIICVCVVVAVSFFFGWLAGSMFLFFFVPLRRWSEVRRGWPPPPYAWVFYVVVVVWEKFFFFFFFFILVISRCAWDDGDINIGERFN